MMIVKLFAALVFGELLWFGVSAWITTNFVVHDRRVVTILKSLFCGLVAVSVVLPDLHPMALFPTFAGIVTLIYVAEIWAQQAGL